MFACKYIFFGCSFNLFSFKNIFCFVKYLFAFKTLFFVWILIFVYGLIKTHNSSIKLLWIESKQRQTGSKTKGENSKQRLLFQLQNNEIKAKIYFSTSKNLSNIYFLIADLINLHSKCFFALFKYISLLASIYFLVSVLIYFHSKNIFWFVYIFLLSKRFSLF